MQSEKTLLQHRGMRPCPNGKSAGGAQWNTVYQIVYTF